MNDIIPSTTNIFDLAFSVPVLSQEEEKKLAYDYYYNGDIQSARKIIMSYLRMVVRIERDLQGYNQDREEMVQEGIIGLMKAVKNYDPTLNIRVSTYASDWIRSAMMEYVIKNKDVVKTITTKAHRKIFFNVNKYRDERGIISEENRERMSSELGVSIKDVRDAIARLTTRFTQVVSTDVDDDDFENGNYELHLACENTSPENEVIDNQYREYEKTNLMIAMDSLNDRERDIVRKRWLDDEKETLQTLSETYGVSMERIRQLEKQALGRVRQYLEHNCDIITD